MIRIYWRGQSKFSFKQPLVETIEREAYPNPQPYTTPCLVMCHAGDAVFAEFLNSHRTEIENHQMAVLAVSGEVLADPGHQDLGEYVHCLKYGLSTPCRDSEIVRRFEKLVEEVAKLKDWTGINLDVEIWSIVERESWPEYLVAAYLGVCAGMPDKVPDHIWGEAWRRIRRWLTDSKSRRGLRVSFN